MKLGRSLYAWSFALRSTRNRLRSNAPGVRSLAPTTVPRQRQGGGRRRQAVGGREAYDTPELATDHEQYLSGHGESPGRWYGATTLGLQGEASPAGFQAMFAGRHPTTGELRGRPHGRNAVPAFDVVCARPRACRSSRAWATRSPAGRSWPPITPGWPRRSPTWTSRSRRPGPLGQGGHRRGAGGWRPDACPACFVPSHRCWGPSGSPGWPTRPEFASILPPERQRSGPATRGSALGCGGAGGACVRSDQGVLPTITGRRWDVGSFRPGGR
jgi:hypothetical protein